MGAADERRDDALSPFFERLKDSPPGEKARASFHVRALDAALAVVAAFTEREFLVMGRLATTLLEHMKAEASVNSERVCVRVCGGGGGGGGRMCVRVCVWRGHYATITATTMRTAARRHRRSTSSAS